MTDPSQGLNASLPLSTCHSTSELKRTLASVPQTLLLGVGCNTTSSWRISHYAWWHWPGTSGPYMDQGACVFASVLSPKDKHPQNVYSTSTQWLVILLCSSGRRTCLLCWGAQSTTTSVLLRNVQKYSMPKECAAEVLHQSDLWGDAVWAVGITFLPHPFNRSTKLHCVKDTFNHLSVL